MAKIINEFAKKQNEQSEQLQKIDGSEWLAENPLKGLVSSGKATTSGSQSKSIERESNQRGTGNIPSPVEQTSSAAASGLGETRGSIKSGLEPAVVVNPPIQQGDLAGSEWLAENPLAKKSSANDDAKIVKRPQSSETVESLPEGSLPVDGRKQPTPKLAWQTKLPPVEEGWLRDDLTFQLRYQPSGHADPVLQAWIKFVAGLPAAKNTPVLKPAFKRLVSADAIGDCSRCHTTDRQADESLMVNWKAEYRDPAIAGFTKFSHGPHLTLPQLRDCSQCHQLEAGRRTADAYLTDDAGHIASNFAPMKVADCATCHRTGSVSNACTQCHNYHVGQTPIDDR